MRETHAISYWLGYFGAAANISPVALLRGITEGPPEVQKALAEKLTFDLTPRKRWRLNDGA